MPSDATAAPLPRKKRSILWLLAALFLLLIGLFVFQLIGPDPQIIVSPQTTYITKPLRPNGLPDYEKYLLDRYRQGVTPENNAAIPLLKLLFPGHVSPTDLRAVAGELGIEEAAPSSATLKLAEGDTNIEAPWHWLFPRWTSEKNLLLLNAWAERTTGEAVWRPWASDQIPPLSKWLADNKGSLDLILEASRRPRYFLPSSTLLNDKHDLLVHMTFPQRNNNVIVLTQTIREASRVLLARAMGHLGDGRPMDAWQDLHALHQLSRLLSQGLTGAELSTARDINTIACYATETILYYGDLTVDEARQIHDDLMRLKPLSTAGGSFHLHEWLFTLDAFVYVAADGDPDQLSQLLDVNTMVFGWIEPDSMEWNTVLREINQLYDRLAAIKDVQDRTKRVDEIAAIEKDLARRAGAIGELGDLAKSEISQRDRRQLFTYVTLGILVSSFEGAIAAEDRAHAKLELTRLAAALAIYRAEHGRYPEKLDDLVPNVLERVPQDIFHKKPYVYQQDDDGFLLYSTGKNGIDDKGRYTDSYFLESPPFDERGRTGKDYLDAQEPIPAYGDDIAVRVPRPLLETPNLIEPNAE